MPNKRPYERDIAGTAGLGMGIRIYDDGRPIGQGGRIVRLSQLVFHISQSRDARLKRGNDAGVDLGSYANAAAKSRKG